MQTPYEEQFKAFRVALVDAAKRADAAAALAVYDEMTRRKVQPTAYVYNTILSICTRVSGRVEPVLLSRAIQIFDKMYQRARRTPPPAAAELMPAAAPAAAAAAATAQDVDATAVAAPAPKPHTEAALKLAAAAVKPQEQAYTSMIRLCALAGQPAQARQFFDRMMEDGVRPRLRTYAPLFEVMSASGDDVTCDWLYAHMKERSISPGQHEFSAYLAVLARKGRWSDVISLLGDMSELVYEVDGPPRPPQQTGNSDNSSSVSSHSSASASAAQDGTLGPSASTEASVSESGDNAASAAESSSVADESEASASDADVGGDKDAAGQAEEGEGGAMPVCQGPNLLDTLEALFGGRLGPQAADGALSNCENSNNSDGSSSSSFSAGDAPSSSSSNGASSNSSSSDWAWACRRVTIPADTGICPVTGYKLRSLDLEQGELQTLATQIEALATGGKTPFSVFKSWLGRHGGKSGFDVIVDGPNIGFANQNFRGGALMYTQIDAVVREYERAGKRVLLVIGARWLDSRRYGDAEKRRPIKQILLERRQDDGSHVGAAVAGIAASSMITPAAAAPTAAAVATPAAVAASGSSNSVASGGDNGGSIAAAASENSSSSSGSSAAQEPATSATAAAAPLSASGIIANNSSSTNSSSRGASSNSSAVAAAPAAMATEVDDLPSPGVVALDAVTDSRAAQAIVERWRQRDLVYAVPPGSNDDWYWLYAAVHCQLRHGKASVALVSNDLMRDHHFAMLAPKCFLKWRERHQTRFKFPCVWDPVARKRVMKPVFDPPRIYSHRVQVSEDGRVWHFPISPESNGGVPNQWLVCWRTSPLATAAAMTAAEAGTSS